MSKKVKLKVEKIEFSTSIKPPLGLIPKWVHQEQVNAERLSQVSSAIARYFDAGLKINIEWVEEYNELIELVSKNTEQIIKANGK